MSEQESRRIDKPGDFPTVEVYERTEPTGKVYRIVFKNLEFEEEKGLMGCLYTLAWVLTFVTLPIISLWIGSIGVPGLLALLFCIGGYIVLFKKFSAPWSIDRTIEFDTRTGALRVLRKGRVEIERPYKRLVNLTVEDHPDAEFKRSDRQQRGEKNLKIEEKQHCLIGWFGEGGAEQVILLYRAEWPCRNSLFEVQQAIMWTLQKITESIGPDDPFSAGPDTMKPPLD